MQRAARNLFTFRCIRVLVVAFVLRRFAQSARYRAALSEGRDEQVSLGHDYLASDAWMTLRAAAISGSVQLYPSMAWFITAHRRTCSL